MHRSFPLFAAVFLIQCMAAPPSQAQPPTVTWEVENRFRFYRDPKVFEYYAKIAKTQITGDLSKWILATEQELQRLYHGKGRAAMFPGVNEPDDSDAGWNGWASLTRNTTCRERSQFDLDAYPDCPDYVAPVSHTVLLTAKEAPPGANCVWTIKPIRTKRKPNEETLWKTQSALNGELMRTPKPCATALRAEIPWDAEGRSYAEVSVALVGGRPSDPTIIRVLDLLVAGMGDSFAAGVGNPDKPAKMSQQPGHGIDYPPAEPGKPPLIPTRPNLGDSGGEQAHPTSTPRFSQGQSEWQDVRCFRSQYGPQFRTALHLAVLMKTAAVTFLDLSCSGGRIIEGLLGEKSLGRGYRQGTPRPKSQIGLASRMLCAGTKTNEIKYNLKFSKTADGCGSLKPREICEYQNRKFQDLGSIGTSMATCGVDSEKRFTRDIDAILLSIGGNDIGFAPMVADVIIDSTEAENKLTRALGKAIGYIHDGEMGKKRLALLKSKYDVLDRVLTDRSILPLRSGAKKPIFLAAYPLPLDDEEKRVCGDHKNNLGDASAALDINPVFSNFARQEKGRGRRDNTPSSRLKSVLTTSCALNLRRLHWFDHDGEAESIKDSLKGLCQDEANDKTRSHSTKNLGWQYVTKFVADFRTHGFCARRGNETLGIPRNKTPPQSWSPDFDNMRPYAERQRWIRTPNDAYMVTNWLPGIPNLADSAVLLSAATTTAMHPTAEGYAVMADAMLNRVSKFLCAERPADFKNLGICEKAHAKARE